MDAALLKEIREKAYSRIPLYYGDRERGLYVGVLIVKSLVGLEANLDTPCTIGELISAGSIKIVEPIYVAESALIENIMNLMRAGSVHLAIVVTQPKQLIAEAELVSKQLCPVPQESSTHQDLEASIAMNPKGHAIAGIVTMENCIEAMLSMNIMDEKDVSRIEKGHNMSMRWDNGSETSAAPAHLSIDNPYEPEE